MGSNINIDEITALLKSAYYEPESKPQVHWESLVAGSNIIVMCYGIRVLLTNSEESK